MTYFPSKRALVSIFCFIRVAYKRAISMTRIILQLFGGGGGGAVECNGVCFTLAIFGSVYEVILVYWIMVFLTPGKHNHVQIWAGR